LRLRRGSPWKHTSWERSKEKRRTQKERETAKAVCCSLKQITKHENGGGGGSIAKMTQNTKLHIGVLVGSSPGGGLVLIRSVGMSVGSRQTERQRDRQTDRETEKHGCCLVFQIKRRPYANPHVCSLRFSFWVFLCR